MFKLLGSEIPRREERRLVLARLGQIWLARQAWVVRRDKTRERGFELVRNRCGKRLRVKLRERGPIGTAAVRIRHCGGEATLKLIARR